MNDEKNKSSDLEYWSYLDLREKIAFSNGFDYAEAEFNRKNSHINTSLGILRMALCKCISLFNSFECDHALNSNIPEYSESFWKELKLKFEEYLNRSLDGDSHILKQLNYKYLAEMSEEQAEVWNKKAKLFRDEMNKEKNKEKKD